MSVRSGKVRVARLTDLLIDASIDKNTYTERKADLLARKRGLQDRLENDKDSTFWQIVAERFELGLDAYTGYLTGIEAEQRESAEREHREVNRQGGERPKPEKESGQDPENDRRAT